MSGKAKSLGAWFPAATIKKVPPLAAADRCSILLFYHYVRPVAMTIERTEQLKDCLERVTTEVKVGGRIRYAQEGLNSTISGTHGNVRAFAAKLVGFGPEFAGTDFKYIDDLPPDRAFKDMKVLPVKELVFYGVDESAAPLSAGGVHLEAKDYHEKMQEENAVIIDVRNSYEAEIGRFVGQESAGGAEYIDPKMRKSTDFAAWLDKSETKDKLKGKQVLMYCTGGVRCERASALLKSKIGDEVEGVFQLQGGVEKYFQAFPDGGHWKGLNYVFDKREAFGVDSIAGVGGVVEGKKKKKKKGKGKGGQDDDGKVLGKCCTCGDKWERYIGKKKCYTCGVPVLMCVPCMSLKIDKTPGRELEVRCPLCKEEGVTIPASETLLTDNGIGAVARKAAAGGQAAPSVMKWGGGHAAEKKRKRAQQQQDSKRKGLGNGKPCRAGDGCQRPNCWFAHPRDRGGDGAGAGAGASHGKNGAKKRHSGHQHANT